MKVLIEHLFSNSQCNDNRRMPNCSFQNELWKEYYIRKTEICLTEKLVMNVNNHLDRQSCRNTIVLNYELEILLKTSATISELGT